LASLVWLPGRIVYAGRLTRLKGVELLIRALRLLPPEAAGPLVVAGDGTERSHLEAVASGLGTAVEFRGWLGRAETQALIASAACLALPSVWPEPCGLAGLEAVAADVPVAAFDVGGIREWLVPGLNGELASAAPPSALGLAGALQRALALRESWDSTREVRLQHLEHFDPGKHFDAVEEVLQNARA
jgi:glycosyltransferase involved in cell wall biosynthesis